MPIIAETEHEILELTNTKPPVLRVTSREDQKYVDYGVNDFIELDKGRRSRHAWEVVVAWRVKNVTHSDVRDLADAFLLQRPEWRETLELIR